jgi:hypothetical protein
MRTPVGGKRSRRPRALPALGGLAHLEGCASGSRAALHAHSDPCIHGVRNTTATITAHPGDLALLRDSEILRRIREKET